MSERKYCSGWLTKEGGIYGSWLKRWFVLTSIKMHYYENEKSMSPKGSIELIQIKRIEAVKDYKTRQFVFRVDTPTRAFYIQTDSESQRLDWMTAINSALSQISSAPNSPATPNNLQHSNSKVLLFTASTKQDIGVTENRTGEYIEKRQEAKKQAERMIREKLNSLKENMKVNANPSLMGALVRTFSFGSQPPEFCKVCGEVFGPFLKKNQCRVCELNFCSKCIRSVTSDHITGVVEKGEALTMCARCLIVATRHENQRKFQESFSQSVAEYSGFVKLYETLFAYKDVLLKLYTNYDYLVCSLSQDINKNKPVGNIYELIGTQQEDLATQFAAFQKILKQMMAFKTPSRSRLERLKVSISSSMTSFLSSHLPHFRKHMQQRRKHLKSSISNLFLRLGRLCFENRVQNSFWEKWKALYEQLIEVISIDLQDLVIDSGETWKEYRERWHLFVSTQWDMPNLIQSKNQNATIQYDDVVRCNIQTLKNSQSKLLEKIGKDQQVRSIDALSYVIQKLEQDKQNNAAPKLLANAFEEENNWQYVY